MKKDWILMSGFNIESSNRGTAALGYGALTFLELKKQFDTRNELAIIRVHTGVSGLFKKGCVEKNTIIVQGKEYIINTIFISYFDYLLAAKLSLILPWSYLCKILKKVMFVAAINGGDGFSDIYGDQKFNNCIFDCKLSVISNVPLIVLPQTIGPYEKKSNYKWAKKILQHAKNVFVRDEKFVDELQKMNVKYELTEDLSAYMKPDPIDIEIKERSVGLNISGLAYSNNYRNLAGKFASYPILVEKIIKSFQQMGCTVYLIPHSYNYGRPDFADDDYEVTKIVYDKLIDKNNVVFVDKNLKSPQIKYVISRMTFFIGTRMHANFAAIYTKTPVFGLAYSYKFAGAFKANGLSEEQTCRIDNLPLESIDLTVDRIINMYKEISK